MALLRQLILIIALFLFFPYVVFAQAQKLRIMALGNSITQSNKDNYSYRYNLWKKLLDAGLEIDYVGSHNVQKNGNPSWPSHKGREFDRDNEGHWGWSADQILYGNSQEPEKGKLEEWLKIYTPDMVLFHLGTNDMFRNHPIDETLDELREVVRLIRASSPDVKIFMAKLVPAYTMKVGPQAASNILALNERIPALAQELHTDESPVILVDQYTGFDPTTGVDTWDGIHPNASGEEKMAQKWFDAIMEIIKIVPVSYAKFEASITEENNVQLVWETTAERGNDFFEVQRAVNGESFSTVGQVDGAGNSDERKIYNFNDTSAPFGRLKYMLKQVSFDGSYSFSDTVQVKKEQVLQTIEAGKGNMHWLQVYPTINTGKVVTIQLQNQRPFSDVLITIYTANGKLVKQLTGQCLADGTWNEQVSMRSSDDAGLYLVQVIANGHSLQRKFILAQ